MTPKEKAMDIFNKMCNSVDELLPFDVKECALIAVNEILKSAPLKPLMPLGAYTYWQEVKQEIEKL